MTSLLLLAALAASPTINIEFHGPLREALREVAKKGGIVTMIGLLVEEAWPTSCGDNWLRQIQVRPVIGEPIKHRWDLFRLIESKRLDPAHIISHTMALGDAVEAYRMFDAREATKIVLKP